MDEREMLELAAKAAGWKLEWGEIFKIGEDEVDCSDMAYLTGGIPDVGPVQWIPMEDEGDALRLAMKLGINLEFGVAQQHVYAIREEVVFYQDADSRGSMGAATCAAIVMCAAEIGKALP